MKNRCRWLKKRNRQAIFKLNSLEAPENMNHLQIFIACHEEAFLTKRTYTKLSMNEI